MNKENVKSITAKIISAILIGLLFCLTIYCFIVEIENVEHRPTFAIINGFNFFACMYSFFYVISGCKKESANLLKIYIVLEGLCHLAAILRNSYTIANPVCPILEALAFGILCVLLFYKDLGRKRSYQICASLIIIDVAIILITNINNFSLDGLISSSSRAVLEIILVFLIKNKYIDKEMRGRKV